MAGGSNLSRRSSIGPKTRSFLQWVAGGRPAPKKSSCRHSTSSTGGEERDPEPGGHHEEHHHEEPPHRHSSSRHTHSSSGERRGSTGHRPHSSSSSHHHHHRHHHSQPTSSSSHHHRSSRSSRSESQHLPRHYTSYSSAPRDVPSSSSVSASEPDPIPYRSDFVPPSTAPTIPEEDEYASDPRASVSVGPWDSISVAGLDPAQYQAYIAAANRNFENPPAAAADPTPAPGPSSSTGQSRRHHGSNYSSSYRTTNTPPPQYQSGSDVPWEDSAYHSAGGSRPASSSSRTRRGLPAYTSHDYVRRQLEQHQQEDVAPYTAVDPDPAYTMNSAYATVPGYHGDSFDPAVCPFGNDGDLVEETDRTSFEYEVEGYRRHFRSSRERTVRTTSRGTH